MAISGSLINDSVGDAVWNIADPAGPNWIKIILNWSQDLAKTVHTNNTATALIPTIKHYQTWATSALITTNSHMENEKETFQAISKIDEAREKLKSTNVTEPTASLILVPNMNNTQLVLNPQ